MIHKECPPADFIWTYFPLMWTEGHPEVQMHVNALLVPSVLSHGFEHVVVDSLIKLGPWEVFIIDRALGTCHSSWNERWGPFLFCMVARASLSTECEVESASAKPLFVEKYSLQLYVARRDGMMSIVNRMGVSGKGRILIRFCLCFSFWLFFCSSLSARLCSSSICYWSSLVAFRALASSSICLSQSCFSMLFCALHMAVRHTAVHIFVWDGVVINSRLPCGYKSLCHVVWWSCFMRIGSIGHLVNDLKSVKNNV